ncbi:MAG: HAMP domain-containing sensor histidine kinase [Coriobacteriia bacterium]|nr:HAMP domain-containing sensor histidine kinase [Coriobacteriia bacterium]
MRLSSFKARIFVISVAVSILLIGFLRITTYLIIAEQMDEVARAEAAGVADVVAAEVREDVATSLSRARQSLGSDGASDADDGAVFQLADTLFIQRVTERFGSSPGFMQSHFALYDTRGALKYKTSVHAVVEDVTERQRAVEADRSTVRHLGGQSLVYNLVAPADLGVYAVHVPFTMPDGATWVLDVIYEPASEVRTIDALRTPMIELGLLALFLTVGAMVGTTLWVLRLVDELRATADSIAAGRLDVRMPERGRNEIGDLGRSLNSLIERLGRAAEAQTRFVADASHELATPVAGIRGHINILRSWGKSDPVVRDESLDAIDRESRRMVRLTRQLLEMIRSEGVITYAPVRRDVNAIARRVLADAATRYQAKELEFIGPADRPLEASVDPDRLEQVLGILVDNAAKYTPSDGRVTVLTEDDVAGVVITVSDTGPGIPEADLPNIFDRFYRADVSRASEGFGLGLAIAKRIVEAGGGAITVASHPAVGTVFTVALPTPPNPESEDESSRDADE